MKKIPKWQKGLDKTERLHLKEMNMNKSKLDYVFSEQKKRRQGDMSRFEPCYTCKSIAVKLGYPV